MNAARDSPTPRRLPRKWRVARWIGGRHHVGAMWALSDLASREASKSGALCDEVFEMADRDHLARGLAVHVHDSANRNSTGVVRVLSATAYVLAIARASRSAAHSSPIASVRIRRSFTALTAMPMESQSSRRRSNEVTSSIRSSR